MPNPAVQVEILIRKARQDRQALGLLLEHYRALLLLRAKQNLSPKLAQRCQPTDLVQETELQAIRDFAQFKGTTEVEFSGWLMAIYRHRLSEILQKHLYSQRRSVQREEMPPEPDSSVYLFLKEPVADQSSPSSIFVKGERDLRLVGLIQTLPEMQRRVLQLHFLEGWPLEKIAAEVGKSVKATGGLVKRGLANLRGLMRKESWL